MKFIPSLLVVMVFAFPSFSEALCVNKAKANLRAKPSSRSTLVWTVGRYMPFLEIGREGSWRNVQDVDGKKMWIHKNLVSSRIDCAVVRKPSSSLRKAPGKSKSKTPLAKAFKYTPFKKLGREGSWLHVEDAFGGIHWVSEDNIWEPLEYSRLSY